MAAPRSWGCSRCPGDTAGTGTRSALDTPRAPRMRDWGSSWGPRMLLGPGDVPGDRGCSWGPGMLLGTGDLPGDQGCSWGPGMLLETWDVP